MVFIVRLDELIGTWELAAVGATVVRMSAYNGKSR